MLHASPTSQTRAGSGSPSPVGRGCRPPRWCAQSMSFSSLSTASTGPVSRSPAAVKDPAAVTITTWRSTGVCVGVHACAPLVSARAARYGRIRALAPCWVMPSTAPDLGVRRASGDRRGRCRALVEAGLPQQRGAGQLDVLGLGCVAALDGPHQPGPHCGADFASSDAAQPNIHGRFKGRVGHLGGEVVGITLCHSLNQRDRRVARRHETTSGTRLGHTGDAIDHP